MEHFYQNIEGWFSYDYIYKHAVETATDNELFIEVGSFKGRSSAYLAVEIANSGKKIRLDCVDTWQGSSEHQAGAECEVIEVVEGTLYETFLKNIEPVKHIINPVRMTSLEAAKLYEDDSVDFIMIDGEHTYEAVKADIQAWLPKMKNGGVMTGDDAFSPLVVRAATEELGKYGVQFPGVHFYATINR
jgi:predicted O-methyltransferase YrrM